MDTATHAEIIQITEPARTALDISSFPSDSSFIDRHDDWTADSLAADVSIDALGNDHNVEAFLLLLTPPMYSRYRKFRPDRILRGTSNANANTVSP